MQLNPIKKQTKALVITEAMHRARFKDAQELLIYLQSLENQDPGILAHVKNIQTTREITAPVQARRETTNGVSEQHTAYRESTAYILRNGEPMSCVDFIPLLRVHLEDRGFRYHQPYWYITQLQLVKEGKLEKLGKNKGTIYRWIFAQQKGSET